MENRESQILSEIKEMMASIRSQLEVLDAKMAELQQVVDEGGADVVPIDLDLDDDLPFADVVTESEPESESEPVHQYAPVVVEVPGPKQAVIDSMTDRQAWRTDMPGSQVRDIRSAISLNDRIFFINYLFNEDPMAFQDTLTKINQMTSLDEVVAYVVENHFGWDLESDVVYRFMMAVRRKVR